MIPLHTALTHADLHAARRTYGGAITRTNAGWQLKTRINGAAVTLYVADEAAVTS